MRALAMAFWVAAVGMAVFTLAIAYDTAHRPDAEPVCYGADPFPAPGPGC